jgi:hypothetical protein
MFDQLFPRHQTRQRHITSPLLQERLDYLQHCAAQGYSPTTLRPLATDLLLIQNVLGLPESSQRIEPAAVKASFEKWTQREPKYFSYRNGRRALSDAAGLFTTGWAEFSGPRRTALTFKTLR